MLSHKQLSTTMALSKTDFEKVRRAIYHNETKEVERYVCSISSSSTAASEQLGTLLDEAVSFYSCLMDDKPDFNAIKNCFANIKLLLQHNASFYIISSSLQDTVIHKILLPRCSRSLLWLFLLKRFYEYSEFTTSKDLFKYAPADFLRSKNTQFKLVQETFSELKPACERYQKAQTELKEEKESKIRFLLYKEMGDLLYEHVVAKEEPIYANLYLGDVIDNYLLAAEEFGKIDFQDTINKNRQDFFELKCFYTDTVKARLVTFESTYGIKITKLTSIDAQITSKLSLVKFPVQGFSSTTFFSEQEKKDSKTLPPKTIKELDELISRTQLASIFAQHLGEATTSSAKLSTQGYHYAKIEPDGTGVSVVTTSSSMFSVGTSSIWSTNSSNAVRHRTATQANDPSSTTFSFTASS